MADSVLTAKLDMSKLQAQTRQLALKSSRTLPQVLNQTGLNAIGRATNATKRVDRLKIQNELGQFIKVDKVNKQGKIVRRNGKIVQSKVAWQRDFYKQGPRIALIINARRRKAGLPGLEGAEMQSAVSKVLRARLFSSGFDRSGWFAGMRELIDAIKASGKKPFIIAQMSGIAAVGQPKGEAKPAQSVSWHPVAMVMNNARNITQADAGALQRGIDAEAAEIKRHLEEDMAPVVKEFNESGKK